MNRIARKDALEQRYSKVEQQIHSLNYNLDNDYLSIRELKKKRLLIKDELARLTYH